MKAMPETATAAERLGAWTAALDLERVPHSARRIAVRCLIDLFAVCIGGAEHRISRQARALALGEHATGPARLFGEGARISATGAAFANAVTAHAYDFDDTCYAGITHGTAVIGPAVLAAAEAANADGRTLLEGFIAGSEVAYGLGKATGNSVYFNGWWGTTVYGAVGAAAGAAKVFGLDGRQTTDAIALAILGTGGMLSGLGTDAKPLTCGFAAQHGIRAALLARAGADGPARVIDGARGFAEVFNDGRFDPAPLGRLGREWSVLEPGIFVKPYPSCSASHAALEALHEMIQSHTLTPGDIARVRCHVPRLVAISLVYDRPASPAEAQFSLPFLVACMIERGRVGVGEIGDGTLADPAIGATMSKVEMIEDADLSERSLAGDIGPECARVEITTTAGATLDRFNGVATGAPGKPMSDAALDGKFFTLATHGGLAENDARALLSRLRSIDTLETLHNLVP
jgi:2-methylcitrate dehydratase PrpD